MDDLTDLNQSTELILSNVSDQSKSEQSKTEQSKSKDPLNLSIDENKTILLDDSVYNPATESSESEQDANKESTGSLKVINVNDLIEGDKLSNDFTEPKTLVEQDDLSDEPVVKDDPEEDDDISKMVLYSNPDRSDEDDVEETVLERLVGLTEMFPDSVRNVGYSVLSGTFPLIKRTYNATRTYSWIFFSTFALLIVPVSIEKERSQTQRQLDREMLLGGGKSKDGLGMAPAPISK